MEGNGYYKNGRNGRSGSTGESSSSSFSTSMLASRSSSSSSRLINSTFSSSYLQKRAQYPSPIPEEEKKHDASSALERRKQRAKLLERNVERHQQELSSTSSETTTQNTSSDTAPSPLAIPPNLTTSSLRNSMSSTGTVAPEPSSRRKSKSSSSSSSKHHRQKEVWGAKSPKRKSKRSKDSSKKKTPGRRPDQDGDDDNQEEEYLNQQHSSEEEPPSLTPTHFQDFGAFGETEQQQLSSSSAYTSSSSSLRFSSRQRNKDRPWMQDTKGTRRVVTGRLSGQHKPLKRKSRNAWRSLLQSGGSSGGLHQYIRNKQQQQAQGHAYSPYDEAFGLCPSIIEEEEEEVDEQNNNSGSPKGDSSGKDMSKTTDPLNTTDDDNDDDDDDDNPQLTDDDDGGTTHLLSAVQEGMELSSLGNISDDAHLTDEELHPRSKSPARGMHRTFSASSGGSTTSSATSTSTNKQNSTTNIVQQGRALAASLRANYLQTQEKQRMRQEEWEKEQQQYFEADKKEFMQGLSGCLEKNVNQGQFEIVEAVATGEHNPDRIKHAFPVEELKNRLEKVFTGDHQVVEGVGKGGVVSPAEKRRRDRMAIERETRELAKIQLALALKARFERHNRFYGITTDDDNHEAENNEEESSEATKQAENHNINQNDDQQKASDNEPSDEEGDSDDDEDDVSVLSMGEQSVATVQSFIVAATILNKERQKGASGEESNNLNTTLSQDDDDEWDEFTVETSRESIFGNMNHNALEQEPSSGKNESTAKMSLGNFLDQRPDASGPSEEQELPLVPDDDDVSEYTLETYYSKQTFSQNVAQADSGFTPQQRKGMSVESLFNPLAMTPPPNAGNNTDGNDNPPPMPEWDASAAESIADALLSIPGALMGVPQPRVRGGMSVRGGDEMSIYDEMTYVSGGEDDEDFEEETYFSNGEDDYDDDDDYWDDQTIQTVADAFVSLPRNIQLEFLATSQAAGNDADDASEASSRAPNPEDFMQKDKAWASSGNTVATTSESESNLGDKSAPMIPSEPRTLEELLKKGLVSRDKMFVESSLCELAVKMEEDKEYRSKVAEAGGILAIVRSMEQNVENPDAQVYASHCLESLSIDAENQESIGEVGGIEAVVGALANHMSVARVAEVTCGCILTLTNQVPNCAVEVAAVDVIVSAMKTHSKNKVIQEKAFQALTRLCLSDKNKLIALSQFGGFSVMSQSLSIHWDEPSVKGQAIFTMAELFNRLAEYQASGEL